MFNRFDWKNTETRTIEELTEKIPVQNLIGKKIKNLNMIGLVESFRLWEIGKIADGKYTLFEPEKDKVFCSFKGNEPFVIVFDDNSTFEIQLLYESLCNFSENQIAEDETEGINHCCLDAAVLFKELLCSVITDIKIEEGISFETDSGYSLKLEFTRENFTRYSLMKNGKYVEKTLCECEKSLRNKIQIPIEQAHNSSSYFWIEPATELDSYSKGEYGVDYAYEAKISIDDTYIVDFMRYYLYKYFDPSLYHVCRDPAYGTPKFGWNLEPNLYEYKTVQKMIAEIRKHCWFLKNDFDSQELDELKKNLRTYSPRIDPDNSKSIQYIRENLEIITDFYQRLCIQLELMMKYYPDYKCIDFMGP